MFDPHTGGGYDGLERHGRNLNQGAESTLAMLATAQQARQISELGDSRVRIQAGLRPDPARVIARLFLPGEELHRTHSRASQVVSRVMSLAEARSSGWPRACSATSAAATTIIRRCCGGTRRSSPRTSRTRVS